MMDAARDGLGNRLAHGWLFAQVLLLVAFARVALRVTSYRVVLAWSSRIFPPCDAETDVSPERIRRAIRVVDRHLPGEDACLPNAVAGKVILERYGFPATIRVGVHRDGLAPLEAHAWVECAEAVIVGDKWLDYYTPLPPL